MSRSLNRPLTPLLLFLVSLGLCAGAGLPARAAEPWTPLGPGAGSLASVTVHPASPGAVWAGLPQGGLFRSADRGATWRWAGRPFAGQWSGVSAVAADWSRPGALWAATDAALFRTEDSGVRWTQASGPGYVAALGDSSPKVVAAAPGVLYLATSKRLLASADGGASWEVLFDVGEDAWIDALAAHPARPRKLYLTGYDAAGPYLRRSLDTGRTWERVASLPIPAAGGIERIALTPGALFVSVGGADRRLFRSADGGVTWRDVLAGKAGAPAEAAAWSVDPRAPRTLYLFGPATAVDFAPLAFWVSRDAGESWKRVGGPPPVYPGRLLIDSAAGALGALYVADDTQLARSVDGGARWSVVLRAPSRESSCAQVAFRPGDPRRMALTVGGTVNRSNDGGQSWSATAVPKWATDVEIDPDDPARLVAVGGNSAFVTEDGGRTWRQDAHWFEYPEMLVRADRDTLLVHGCGVYRSDDDGDSWRTTLPCWTRWAEELRWSQKLEVDPSDPAKVYVLTFLVKNLEQPHGVLAGYPSVLWKSADGGRTWGKIAQNLRTFALDPSSSRLYGVRNRDVLASDDGGKSWRAVARTPRLIHDLLVDPADADVFYAGDDGVLRSTDRGATWQRVGAGVWGYALTLHPSDRRTLYVADPWGVRKLRLPELP